MLCREIVNTEYPIVQTSEDLETLLGRMEAQNLSVLPVFTGKEYKGLVSKEMLSKPQLNWEDLLQELYPAAVLDDDHIFRALRVMSDQHLYFVAVLTKEHDYVGMISTVELQPAVSLLLGLNDAPGGCLTLEMNRTSYSFGELARLIETNDADLLQLNTYMEASTGLFIINLKVSRTDISDIVATLQRYGYVVRYFFGLETYENELKRNYDALINYLNI